MRDLLRRNRLIVLAVLGAGVVAAGAVAAVAILRDDDEAELVERPATAASVPSPAATVELEARVRVPPLTRAELRRQPNAELGRKTPLAQADLFTSADVPATELRDANDPTGSGDAYALFGSSLVSKGAAFYIAEPNLAAKGDRVFVVWNIGAAFSDDGGRTFTYVDPRTAFPKAYGGFCCDQLAYYIPGADLWIWLLQYFPGAGGDNVIRIAVARGDEGFDQRRFHYHDFEPRDFPRLGTVGDLDYPSLSATARHLFASLNFFVEDRYRSTLVLRLPIEGLAGTEPFGVRYLVSTVGTVEFTQGADDTMYFAEHVDAATLRVSQWADDASDPTSAEVPHRRYATDPPAAYRCPRTGAATGDWCERQQGEESTNDDRPNAGWVTEDTVGFAWNAPASAASGFPYPYVMVVRIDRETLKTRDEPAIWNPDYAYQYASLAPNGRGDLGGVVLAGGGTRFQTCATLLNDGPSGGSWDARIADSSDADPLEDQSGDFLGAVPSSPGANSWVGSCMTLHGGGSEENVEIRFVRFGRAKDGP